LFLACGDARTPLETPSATTVGADQGANDGTNAGAAAAAGTQSAGPALRFDCAASTPGEARLAWVLPLAKSSGEGGLGFAHDGKLWIGGAFVGTLDLGVTTFENDGAGNQAFAALVEPTQGTPLKAFSLSGLPAAVHALGEDATGALYLTGYGLKGAPDLGPGLDGPAWYAKVDAASNVLFAGKFTVDLGETGIAVAADGRFAVAEPALPLVPSTAVFSSNGTPSFSVAGAVPCGYDGSALIVAGTADPELVIGGKTAEAQGTRSVVVASLAADGSPTWARAVGADARVTACSVANGRIVVGGSFAGTLAIGEQSAAAEHALFHLVLDSNGAPLRLRAFASHESDWVRQVGIDGAGRVAMLVYASSSIAIDGLHGVTGFVARFGTDGIARELADFGSSGLLVGEDGTTFVRGIFQGNSLGVPIPDSATPRDYVAAYCPLQE
jgi:hypothetical protein